MTTCQLVHLALTSLQRCEQSVSTSRSSECAPSAPQSPYLPRVRWVLEELDKNPGAPVTLHCFTVDCTWVQSWSHCCAWQSRRRKRLSLRLNDTKIKSKSAQKTHKLTSRTTDSHAARSASKVGHSSEVGQSGSCSSKDHKAALNGDALNFRNLGSIIAVLPMSTVRNGSVRRPSETKSGRSGGRNRSRREETQQITVLGLRRRARRSNPIVTLTETPGSCNARCSCPSRCTSCRRLGQILSVPVISYSFASLRQPLLSLAVHTQPGTILRAAAYEQLPRPLLLDDALPPLIPSAQDCDLLANIVA